MTRIFEALKKSQSGAFPFPPADPGPLRPATVTRPASPAAAAARAVTLEPAITLRTEPRPALALPPEVLRQMTALRVGLEAALEGRTTRVVMFVGPMGGEGVTTIATQFASALVAESRGPSLLLDARAGRSLRDRGLDEARISPRLADAVVDLLLELRQDRALHEREGLKGALVREQVVRETVEIRCHL